MTPPFANSEKCSWSSHSPYHTFAMSIRSLSEMAIKLDELIIEGRQNGISNHIFSRTSPTDHSHLLNVFANLRKIDISVTTHNDACRLDYAGLGEVLTHATMLQSLDLRCTFSGRRKSRLILSRLFRDFTWPHLKHFGLHGFNMHTNSELIAFFDRHRATIDSVMLGSIFLHERAFDSLDISPCEAWKHFFGELRKRSIKFQNLELCKIHDCCNWEGEHPDLTVRGARGRRVLEYLRDGGPNPLEVDTSSETSESGEER